jgi:hypothetical protein
MLDYAQPGQAHHVITPDVISAVDGHIRANRRITSLWKLHVLHSAQLLGTNPCGWICFKHCK